MLLTRNIYLHEKLTEIKYFFCEIAMQQKNKSANQKVIRPSYDIRFLIPMNTVIEIETNVEIGS